MKVASAVAAVLLLAQGSGVCARSGSPASSPLEQSLELSIDRQPLQKTIDYLCALVNLNCVPQVPLTEGMEAPAIHAKVPFRVALKRVLSPFGLTFSMLDASTVSITRLPRAQLPKEAPREKISYPGSSTSVDPLKEVKITGTLIEDSNVGGSPVRVLTMKDIADTGASSVQELLSTLSQSSGSSTPDTSLVFSTISGLENRNWGYAVDLRGLGAGATLVLINGQHAPPSAGGMGGYFDLSTLPLDLVERVEVVIDGTSAVYGSDAIGGVVNLIVPVIDAAVLTGMHFGRFTQGGGSSIWWSQRAGRKWGSLQAGIAYRGQKDAAIDAQSRKATRGVMDSGYTSANISPRQTTDIVLANAQWDFSDTSHIRLDVSYAGKNMVNRYSSSALGGVDVTNHVSTKQYWSMAEFTFALPYDWAVRLNAGASDSRVKTELSQNIPSLDWLMLSDGDTSYKTRYFGAHAEGSLFSLPTGRVGMTVDMGAGHESLRVSESSRTADDMRRTHAFAKFSLPLWPVSNDVESNSPLLLTVAERYERYSSFGDSTVYKVGLQWMPMGGLRLRATTAESTRAPGLNQLSVGGTWQAIDNVANATESGETVRVLSRFGSNPDLGPEVARTVTAGFDFSTLAPFEFHASATWFSDEYTGRIEPVQASYLTTLQDPAYAVVRTPRGEMPDDQLNAEIVRLLTNSTNNVTNGCGTPNYIEGPCFEAPGNIHAILDFRERNLAETSTDGVDWAAKAYFPNRYGKASVSFEGTYIFNFDSRVTAASPNVAQVNTLFYPPSLRLRAGAGFERGRLHVNAFLNYMNAYENNSVDPHARISAQATVDLSLRFDSALAQDGEVPPGYSLALQVTNLLDADPPFVASPFRNGFNYDARNADPYGRLIALTVTKKW